jgi:hypothetical protein
MGAWACLERHNDFRAASKTKNGYKKVIPGCKDTLSQWSWRKPR